MLTGGDRAWRAIFRCKGVDIFSRSSYRARIGCREADKGAGRDSDGIIGKAWRGKGVQMQGDEMRLPGSEY